MDIAVEPIEDSPDQTAGVTASSADSLQHLAIAERFGIDRPDKLEDGKLREIWDYARSKSRSEDIPEIIWTVMNLEQTLGAPRYGEERLDRLYRYAKLRRQESLIQSQLKELI